MPAIVCVLVFLYRFNTLSGELGGFDNDHFINLARANQLLAGEWPLRDYPDASLQAAWPPLTYMASAGAQIVFGESLFAEAVLTAAAVAISAALSVRAARALGLRPELAVVAAVAGVLPSVKLYGYARPLLFAAQALLICRYVDAPSPRRLTALSALAAVALVVRHDYAVYLGIGAVVTLLVHHGSRPREAATRLLRYGVVAALLLVPTMASVHYLAGFDTYVDGARTLMADERARTNLKWPVFDAANPGAEENTFAWLYYAYLALPPAAAIAAVLRARGAARAESPVEAWAELAKVLGIAAMGAVTNQFLLRGNLEARLPDPAVLHALLGSWLVAVSWQAARHPELACVGGVGRRLFWRNRRVCEGRPALQPPTRASSRVIPRCSRLARTCVALAITIVAAVSVVALGRVGAADREFGTAGFREGFVTTVRTTLLVTDRLRNLPPSRWEPPPASGAMLAAAYLSACTAPTDRVINATYDADHLVFARRRFAAGRVNFVPGFYTSEREQTQAVALAERQAPPVALTDPPPDDDWLAEDFPIFNTFLRERYVDAGPIPGQGKPYLHVLVLRGLPASGTFANTGLPCFRR